MELTKSWSRGMN